MFFWLLLPGQGLALSPSMLNPLIGKHDAVLLADASGTFLFARHEDALLIPASTLKILTSLLALHHLGPDHRYLTQFYLDPENRLKVQGFGDPFLVSESLSVIAKALKHRLRSVNGILLDDSHFDKPIEIPGITDSFEPYDAPNGALCVNFNTVSFQRTDSGFISAESQTPLLPTVMRRIRESGLDKGRIVLSNKEGEATRYAGHLLRFFLEKEKITVSGPVTLGRVNPASDRLVFTHVSNYRLQEILERLMEHSSNFIANQLLVTVGAKAFGAPGTLEKGVRAARRYVEQDLKIRGIRIAEGSGISRQNRVTARAMHQILSRFMPYRHLLPQKQNAAFKTGTLKGVRAMAGYIERGPGKVFPFVILINTPGKTADRILSAIQARLP